MQTTSNYQIKYSKSPPIKKSSTENKHHPFHKVLNDPSLKYHSEMSFDIAYIMYRARNARKIIRVNDRKKGIVPLNQLLLLRLLLELNQIESQACRDQELLWTVRHRWVSPDRRGRELAGRCLKFQQ